MARLLKYIAYIVITASIGFAAYIYYLVALLFVAILLYGTIDAPPIIESLVASIFVVFIPPILFGLSAYGFYYVLKLSLESFRVELSLKVGAMICSIATVYILLCFLPFIFPELHIPFSIF